MLGRSAHMCAALMDGPTEPVDIRSMAGHDGRLLLFDEDSKRVRELNGVLRKIDRHVMAVSLTSPSVESLVPGASVVLEIIDSCSLIQCFTFVISVDKTGKLVLQTPSRLHTVQRRRYPRVDVYVSITLLTLDHSVDPLPGHLINLSADGAACVVTEPVAIGTPITLNLAALGLFPANVCAEAIRCSPNPNRLWVIAMRFRSQTAEQQLYLDKYVSDCLR